MSSDQHIDVSGSPGVSGSGSVTGTVRTNQPPTPDPLAYLPEPTMPNTKLNANPSNGIGQVSTYLDALGLTSKLVTGQVYILEPGNFLGAGVPNRAPYTAITENNREVTHRLQGLAD